MENIPYHGYLISFFIGYFMGSIPFGLIIAKIAGLGDVRNIGSGNIGATNVLRTGNKKVAAMTLAGDILKGAIPVWIMLYFQSTLNFDMFFVYMTGIFAFLGHLFPVWLKFKGGKGVATYIGVILAGYPLGVVIFAIMWLLTAYVSRYSSLAALVASLATTIGLNFLSFEWSVASLIMTVLLYIKHHENIKRLYSGEESKIGQKG